MKLNENSSEVFSISITWLYFTSTSPRRYGIFPLFFYCANPYLKKEGDGESVSNRGSGKKNHNRMKKKTNVDAISASIIPIHRSNHGILHFIFVFRSFLCSALSTRFQRIWYTCCKSYKSKHQLKNCESEFYLWECKEKIMSNRTSKKTTSTKRTQNIRYKYIFCASFN